MLKDRRGSGERIAAWNEGMQGQNSGELRMTDRWMGKYSSNR